MLADWVGRVAGHLRPMIRKVTIESALPADAFSLALDDAGYAGLPCDAGSGTIAARRRFFTERNRYGSFSGAEGRTLRMVTPERTCPWVLKALDLLKREWFEVEDHPLKSREQTDAFKAKHQVETTPRTFIGEQRGGGYIDLREYLGKEVKDKGACTYFPVIALFGMSLAMTLAASWAAYGTVTTVVSA